MSEDSKKLGGCCCCIAFITAIVLVAVSFKTIDVNDVCLKYDTFTRVVAAEPTKEQGTVFSGIDKDFLCFPRTVQKLSFTPLKTRTKEGLLVGIDVSVEYKLLPSGLKDLFDLVTLRHVELYNNIAQSVLRNAASKYEAASILKSSGPISSTMRDMLETKFNKFYASIVAVQVRQITLPYDVQSKLQKILDIGLQKDEATEKRTSQVAELSKESELEYKRVDQSRVTKKNSAERKFDVTIVNRNKELTSVSTLKQRKLIEYASDRAVAEQQVNAKVSSATTERAGKLQREKNDLATAEIEVLDNIAIAKAQAKVKEVQGTALYEAQIIDAGARADVLSYSLDAENVKFKSLKDSAAFAGDHIVRHEYLDTLKERHNDVDFFVDYKKVPMFMESTGNAKKVKELNAGDAILPWLEPINENMLPWGVCNNIHYVITGAQYINKIGFHLSTTK